MEIRREWKMEPIVSKQKHDFTWDSQKYIFGKKYFEFSKQNKCKLKDLKWFKVLWTTS